MAHFALEVTHTILALRRLVIRRDGSNGKLGRSGRRTAGFVADVLGDAGDLRDVDRRSRSAVFDGQIPHDLLAVEGVVNSVRSDPSRKGLLRSGNGDPVLDHGVVVLRIAAVACFNVAGLLTGDKLAGRTELRILVAEILILQLATAAGDVQVEVVFRGNSCSVLFQRVVNIVTKRLEFIVIGSSGALDRAAPLAVGAGTGTDAVLRAGRRRGDRDLIDVVAAIGLNRLSLFADRAGVVAAAILTKLTFLKRSVGFCRRSVRIAAGLIAEVLGDAADAIVDSAVRFSLKLGDELVARIRRDGVGCKRKRKVRGDRLVVGRAIGIGIRVGPDLVTGLIAGGCNILILKVLHILNILDDAAVLLGSRFAAARALAAVELPIVDVVFLVRVKIVKHPGPSMAERRKVCIVVDVVIQTCIRSRLVAGVDDVIAADVAVEFLGTRFRAGCSLGIGERRVAVLHVGVDGLQLVACFAGVVTHTGDLTIAGGFITKVLAAAARNERSNVDRVAVECNVLFAVPDLTGVFGEVVGDDFLAVELVVCSGNGDNDLEGLFRRNVLVALFAVRGNDIGVGLFADIGAVDLLHRDFHRVRVVDDRVAGFVADDLAVLVELVQRRHRDGNLVAADLAETFQLAFRRIGRRLGHLPIHGVVTGRSADLRRLIIATRALKDRNTAVFADGLTFSLDVTLDLKIVTKCAVGNFDLLGLVAAGRALHRGVCVLGAGCGNRGLFKHLFVVKHVVDDLGVTAVLIDLEICTVDIGRIACLVKDGIAVPVHRNFVGNKLDDIILALVLTGELGDLDFGKHRTVFQRDDQGLAVFAERDALDAVALSTAAAADAAKVFLGAVAIVDDEFTVNDLSGNDRPLGSIGSDFTEVLAGVVRIVNNELAICVDCKRADASRIAGACGKCKRNTDHATDDTKNHQKFNSQLSDSLNHCLFSFIDVLFLKFQSFLFLLFGYIMYLCQSSFLSPSQKIAADLPEKRKNTAQKYANLFRRRYCRRDPFV